MKKLIGYAPLAGSAVVLLGALTTQAQIIDDYSTSLSLSPYTLTPVDLGAGHGAGLNISLSDGSGALVANYAGASFVEQDVFLRNDISLPVGSMLVARTLFPLSATQMDFGIMVADTATPTAAVGGPSVSDTRNKFNWASISIRPSQGTGSLGAIRVNTVQLNGTPNTGSGILNAAANTVSALAIERLSDTTFAFGYFNTSGTFIPDSTVTGSTFTSTSVGSAIGFYTDLRGAGSLGGFLDLSIQPIPEPCTVGLLGLGGLLGVFAMRRRK